METPPLSDVTTDVSKDAKKKTRDFQCEERTGRLQDPEEPEPTGRSSPSRLTESEPPQQHCSGSVLVRSEAEPV